MFGLIRWRWDRPTTLHPQNIWFIDVMMDAMTNKPAPVILIVEDDPFLRMLAVEFVNEAGFETLQARDADQAIAILESCSRIAVLFTDINMPGSMDGLKLARVVNKRWPVIEILIASGHVQLRQADLPPNGRFLGKPYHAAAMIAELHSLVSHGAPLMKACHAAGNPGQ
jgi:two-component system, response regulator PdtaR